MNVKNVSQFIKKRIHLSPAGSLNFVDDSFAWSRLDMLE
jgi:hypothetical protein